MKAGKAFELLVKNIMLHIGFYEVHSDGLYIFDGAPGQMIQGLGDAHNADVLLDPPVQTPFYAPTRLLIECKDYSKRVGLNTLRSALGLREDINHFDIVDRNELEIRRRNRRAGICYDYPRYSYQVAVASMSGFTIPAQSFAVTHRIPLIEFNKMPFWRTFCAAISCGGRYSVINQTELALNDDAILKVINEIAERCAIAITNSGQMLFLYRTEAGCTTFSEQYSLHWNDKEEPWVLHSGDAEYQFQLPSQILKIWLENSVTDLDRKINAINCKANYLSHMVVYYSECGMSQMKMISIDRYRLEEAVRSIE